MQVKKGDKVTSIQSRFLKKKKKTLGFEEKQRTIAEINQEYNQHAALYGHGATLIAETEAALAKAHADQEVHLSALMRLRSEAAKASAEQPKQPEETAPA